MKLTRKKPAAAKVKGKKSPAAKKKQSFDFKAFSNSLNALNKDNYGSAPAPVKGFLIVVMLVVIGALTWFLLAKPKLEEIKSAEAQEAALLEQYREKEAKARHLQEYKDQIAQMELDFAELLAQLPKDKQVSDLIEGINLVGSGSGIRFKDISTPEEIEQEFFIEQPIVITAIGEYHQFGNFATGIAALPRIITMHNFEIKNDKPSLEKMPELQLVLNTKTYRSKEIAEEAAPADAAAATTEGAK